MPTNRELEVIMKLRDEISKKLSGVQGAFQRFSNSTRELGEKMRTLGRELGQIGSGLARLGVTITGPLILAFKNMDKYSSAVHYQVVRLQNVTNQFQLSLANALAPTIGMIIDHINRLFAAWQSLGPVVQQQIIHGAFMVGVFLSIGAAAIALVSQLMKIMGAIAMINSSFLSLIAVNAPLLLIIATLATIITLMFKFKAVADVVMSTIEILFMFFINGLEAIRLVFSRTIAFILGLLEKTFNFFSKLPGPTRAFFKSLSDGVKNMRLELDKFGDQAIPNIQRNTERIGKIFTSGEGSFSRGFDDFKKKIMEIWNLMKNPPKIDIAPVVQSFNAIEEIARGTAQAMSQAFGQLFFNVFTGQIRNMKQVFADFGRQILQVFSNALAKFVLIKTIGTIFPSFGQYFHSGGIVRAHGGLAIDEVPIIAQTGEGVLSRKGMNALGRKNFDRINRGESVGGGGVTINVSPIVQLWDASDVERNKKTLIAAVSQAITTNGQIRKIIKEYA